MTEQHTPETPVCPAGNHPTSFPVNTAPGKPFFSFEVLPPVRGKGMDSICSTIEKLMPYDPAFVNITTHRSETVYSEKPDGRFERLNICQRPGTVAIAAAIKGRYGLRVVPHIICAGFSAAEIERELIDLSYLGITDLLVLRGDRAKGENRFIPTPGGHAHALELCEQVNRFNAGHLLGETEVPPLSRPFTYGVAGYPEKHDEAMNPDDDLRHAVEKVRAGASYIVTQMFFDNARYFDFVERLRRVGVTVPVIPGLKPLTTLGHRNLLPKTFHIDFPVELSRELERCTNNDDVKQVGVEWARCQCEGLRAKNVAGIHFYTMNAAASVERIMRPVL